MPIVPAAILFDLGFGGDPKIRPTADCGYRAAGVASDGAGAEGNVGAGAGATRRQDGRPRPGDEGRHRHGRDQAAERPGGRGAIVAVNAVGDIIDPTTGQVVAGVRTADGKRWPTRASCFATAA